MSRFSRAGLERSVEALWYGRSTVALVLQPLAFLYRILVATRVCAYRQGLLRRERVPVPVIIVGNIAVGGTGKTPIVAWLAGRLSEMGRRPGIVSRGYGGRPGPDPLMVDEDSDFQQVGDEALVLARRTGAPVCVAVDRVAAARYLLDQAGVDIVIADDGLQHYRLARDLEIAVVDGQREFGNRRMLPAGPLREPVRRLREVDVVLVNGDSDKGFILRPGKAVSLDGSGHRDLDQFGGKRVWSVAGIGNPRRFFEMLRSFAIDPVMVDIADHGAVSLTALRCERPWPILMTEKDAVKYLDNPVDDAWYVPVDVQMSAQAESEVMNRIQSLATAG